MPQMPFWAVGRPVFSIVVMLFLAACSSAQMSKEERQAKILYSQGSYELYQKDYANAITHLEQANQLSPRDSNILNNLGMAYYFKNQTPLALNYLQQALQANPKNQDARSNLATIYMEQGKYDQALAEYQIVLQDVKYTAQFVTHYNLAKLALAQNKTQQAIKELKLSLAEKEDYCAANFTLAEIYAKEYRYQQALELFRKSTRGSCINNIDGHYQQALMEIELKHYANARSKLRDIIEHYTHDEHYIALANEALRKLDRLAPETEIQRIKSRWEEKQNELWQAQQNTTPVEFNSTNF
ncbi:MAG: tetratricopeptide repeat protein [Bacteriovoracaceae bacterium]|nr:tetratricopeptide repeat protein [Bacteriovoracaceae bacterium]